MRNISVELLSFSPIRNAIIGARTCWQSFDRDDYENEENIGKNNEDLLRRLVQKYKHESVIEHVNYTLKIKGASRGFLQQLVRHRIASYSVQSTRYTLKKLLKKDMKLVKELFAITGGKQEDEDRKRIVEKYCVVLDCFTEEEYAGLFSSIFRVVRATEKHGNDVAKYFIPEAWRTELVWTVNARELRHFLNLRLKPDAHFEIRHVANLVVKVLPKEHLILFEDLLEEADVKTYTAEKEYLIYCPSCKCYLVEEDVEDNKCPRCGGRVYLQEV